MIETKEELARAEQEFARRQRAVRRRRWLPWLVAGLVLSLLLVSTWALYFSSFFAVAGIRVFGAETVSDAQVRLVAGVPIGRPLLRVDVDAVARRVEAMPAIADARVIRAWPDRVEIRVTERVPVVALGAAGGFELVDGTGTVFRTVAARPAGLPVAEVSGGRRTDTIAAVVAVVGVLPDGLKDRIRSITAASPDSIRLSLNGRIQVVWGSAEDSPRKLAVLTVLMKRPAVVYDVSAPDLPVTQGSR